MLAAPRSARGQQAGQVYRVGFLSRGGSPTLTGNLVVSVALAGGQPERLPGPVAILLQANVDAIVTTSTPETRAARAAKSATAVTPIVMTLAPDPVEQGLVASLARPRAS